MQLSKYQALGNDYLICPDSDEARELLTDRAIRKICDRHYGIGSDGILIGSVVPTGGAFRLRILNPDGSEAEKSGNGLRIYAKYLWDLGLVSGEKFAVFTLGGRVRCQVIEGKLGGPDGGNSVANTAEVAAEIAVEMGQVRFNSNEIPMSGPPREVLRETIDVELPSGKVESCEVSAATIGNPHCVVLKDTLCAAEVRRLGPLLENAGCFPERTNVQFMKIRDRSNVEIEIWERGAGYTLASGSSSSASAAVAKKLGLVDECVSVHMPGGVLRIDIDDAYHVRMRGPAAKVADVELAGEFLAEIP